MGAPCCTRLLGDLSALLRGKFRHIFLSGGAADFGLALERFD
jgi:hypothetical protein